MLCAVCQYETNKRSNWNKHCCSRKHQNNLHRYHIPLPSTTTTTTSSVSSSATAAATATSSSSIAVNIAVNVAVMYHCPTCGRSYKSRNGVWKHKRGGTCAATTTSTVEPDAPSPSPSSSSSSPRLTSASPSPPSQPQPQPLLLPQDRELILTLIKQNAQLVECNQELMERLKQSSVPPPPPPTPPSTTNNNHTNHTTTIHHNTTHNDNRTFNLHFFLNETCKDAMNLTDFVNTIQVRLSDVERLGQTGYVEGITNLITTHLRALDVTQRPIHCTDKKRETLYVKDEDRWEKEDDQKQRMRRAVQTVAHKNLQVVGQFRHHHPACENSASGWSQTYNRLVLESLGGEGGGDQWTKDSKIIHNISREVLLDKTPTVAAAAAAAATPTSS